MAAHSSVILQSIEEELAKLALEVDVMESKIAWRRTSNVNEEEPNNEDAETVVSLSESECGSMGSFEEFVHCSLPPLTPKMSSEKGIAFSLESSRRLSRDSFTQIPRLNKAVGKKKMAVADAQVGPLLKMNSWKIGVEEFDSFSSSTKSGEPVDSGKMAWRYKEAPEVTSIEVPKIVQKILAKASKIPRPPRTAVVECTHAPRVDLSCTLGASNLPKPPAAGEQGGIPCKINSRRP